MREIDSFVHTERFRRANIIKMQVITFNGFGICTPSKL